MGAVFVIVFLGIVLLKHFGAVVRESNYNNHFRQNATENNEKLYYSMDGFRYTNNNHKVRVDDDKYLGKIVTDLITGEKYYQGIDELLKEYHKAKVIKDDYRDFGDVWYSHLGQTFGYVDKTTEEVYLLACAKGTHDMNKGRNYGEAWFYTDLGRTKFIRRTRNQIKYDTHNREYTDEEIRNYVDQYADQATSNKIYRELDGKWVPQGVEPQWLSKEGMEL